MREFLIDEAGAKGRTEVQKRHSTEEKLMDF